MCVFVVVVREINEQLLQKNIKEMMPRSLTSLHMRQKSVHYRHGIDFCRFTCTLVQPHESIHVRVCVCVFAFQHLYRILEPIFSLLLSREVNERVQLRLFIKQINICLD